MQVTPAELFEGYTFANNSITIPLSALPGLAAAEADPTTGNGMEVLRQILDRAQAYVAALAPAARPTRANITKQNPAIATGTAVVPGTLRQNYTVSFDLTPTALELASEA